MDHPYETLQVYARADRFKVQKQRLLKWPGNMSPLLYRIKYCVHKIHKIQGFWLLFDVQTGSRQKMSLTSKKNIGRLLLTSEHTIFPIFTFITFFITKGTEIIFLRPYFCV
jgi:hypothetical protein